MSDSRDVPRSSHDHPEPDQAALDELLQAFADEPDEPAEPAVDDLIIVEQDPLPEPDETRPADTPASGAGDEDAAGGAPAGDVDASPRIIRIDDYSAASGEHSTVDELDEESPAPDVPDVPGEPVVIEIDDEELPDAVYVEGSLDRDGSRTIVFIEDDDTGDALKPESERDLRRGIEPRMRERRVAIKRAQSRKRLKWLIVIAVVLLLVIGALAVLGSSLFAVQADQLTVTGAVYTDEAELDAIVDDLVGTPVLRVDTQEIERRLEAIPWVEDAKVTTSFPRAASIEIRERQPQATYRGPDGRFRVLDDEGRVLDVIDGQPIAYVLVGGPDPVDLDAGEFAPRGYAAAAELAKNLTGSVRGQVFMIEVAADGSDLVLHLSDGTAVRFGEARDLFSKLVRLETVLSSTEDREPGDIDVSTREVTR